MIPFRVAICTFSRPDVVAARKLLYDLVPLEFTDGLHALLGTGPYICCDPWGRNYSKYIHYGMEDEIPITTFTISEFTSIFVEAN